MSWLTNNGGTLNIKPLASTPTGAYEIIVKIEEQSRDVFDISDIINESFTIIIEKNFAPTLISENCNNLKVV